MNTPPPLLQSEKTLFHRAALISLYSPLAAWLLAIVINGLIGPSLKPESAHLARQVVGSIAFLLFPAGFVSGTFALLGMRKVGRKGILGRAIVGVVLCGFAILAFLPLLREILRKGFH
jgi:hypothetical protein